MLEELFKSFQAKEIDNCPMGSFKLYHSDFLKNVLSK